MKAGERIVFIVMICGLAAWAAHQQSVISELQRRAPSVSEMPSPGPRAVVQNAGVNRSSSGNGEVVPGNTEVPPRSGAKQLSARELAPKVWRSIESDDYKTYIQNLRASGCPEKTIQDIVVADVLQTYKERRRQALTELTPEFKYWNAKAADPEQTNETWRKQRELNEEMRGVIQQLVGDSFQLPPLDYVWKAEETYQRLEFLPEEKRDSVHDILMRYADVEVEIKQLSDWKHPGKDAEGLAQLWSLYEERQEVLKKMLTPEQYAEMDMSVSWTGDNLRNAMVKFNPTEEEFRFIFEAWRAHDEDLARRKAMGEEDPGNEHVYAKIKESMDEKRFELYRSTWWKR